MQVFSGKSFRKFEFEMRKIGQNILEHLCYYRKIKPAEN